MSVLGDKFLSESSWNLCQATGKGRQDWGCRRIVLVRRGAKVQGQGWQDRTVHHQSGRARHGLVREAQDALRRHPRHRVRGGHLHHITENGRPCARGTALTWSTEEPKVIVEEAGAPAGFIFNMYKHSEDTLIAHAAHPRAAVASPPPPPLPPMAAGLKASLSLKGYTKATFGLDEQLAFRESVASLLGGANSAETASSSPPSRTSRLRRAGVCCPPAPDVLRGEDHVHRRVVSSADRAQPWRPASPPGCSATPARSSRR